MSSEYRAPTRSHSHSSHHRYRRRRRGPSGLVILLAAAAVFIVIVLFVSFLGQKPESQGGVTQPSDTPAPTETVSPSAAPSRAVRAASTSKLTPSVEATTSPVSLFSVASAGSE